MGLLGLALAWPIRAQEALDAVVAVPAADVWSEPAGDPAQRTDDKRETQVLFGERVLVHESSGIWARIEALEQPEHTHHDRWEGYPGWVAKDALAPLHGMKERARTAPANHPDPRRAILAAAVAYRGIPYVWGGLTPNLAAGASARISPSMRYGVDCSGLVHIAYRINGIQIPRDAHEQWMKATPIQRDQLQPADLVFSASANKPEKVTHVALYAGGDRLIEAPQTGLSVRLIRARKKFGRPLSRIESGDVVGDRVIYFGRYLPP